MTAEYLTMLFVVGVCGGIVSGLLGIGGGIILAPLLLYVPPAFGLTPMDMKVVSGLTIVQSLFASLSGVLVHHKFRFVHRGLALWMGITMAATSFGGAWLSQLVSARMLLGLFSLLAIVAAGMMLIPKPQADREIGLADVAFSRAAAVAAAMFIGLLGGMVGQSGAFILIPTMIYVLRIPTRITIGTSLAVVLCAAAATTAGKIVTGQVAGTMAVVLVPGALIGAQIGSHWSKRVPAGRLRHALALVIAASAAKMWYELLV